jgi:integrase
MALSIESALERLLDNVKAAGRADATLKLYRSTLKPLIKECGYSVDEPCDQNTVDNLLKAVEKRYADGKIVFESYRFSKRACRLLYESGTGMKINLSADTSHMRRFVPDNMYDDITEDIIQSCHFCESSEVDIGAHIRRFFCFIKDKNVKLNDIQNSTFFQFIDYCSETVKGTRYRVVRAVKCLSEYFKQHKIGNITADFSGLKAGPRNIRLIPAFSSEEIERFLRVIDTDTPTGKRDKAIITLAAATGIRGCDIADLTFSCIDWKKKTIHFIQRKIHRPLLLPVPNSVLNDIADYILHGRPNIESQYVFLTSRAPYKQFDSSIYSIMKRYSVKAGVENIRGRGFHSVRRFFATQSIQNGVSIFAVSEMLGHKDISEDRVYLSVDAGMNSFVAADFSDCPLSGTVYTSSAFGGSR